MEGSLQIEGINGNLCFKHENDNTIRVLRKHPETIDIEHMLLGEVRNFSVGGVVSSYAYKSFCDDYFLFEISKTKTDQESL